jgi:hypothetical protein
MSAALTRAASSAPTAALDAALVPSMTLLATVFALVAVILVDVLPTPPRAHRVAPAVAPVALRVVPIPIGPTRIRRPLSNASSTGVIVACRRTPVSMPRCWSATTSSLSRFFLRLAARIIKTTAPSPFSLKLPRTLCVWAVTLPTTTTLKSTFLCLYVLRCLFSWERTGHLLWRAICLEGYLLGGLFFCVCDFVFFLSPWMDHPSLRYQMVYAIFMEIIIPIPYSIIHTLCYM